MAKYSTSYGSTLVKLPDRQHLVSSGNISRAAAAVFQQVKKDNQASKIRRANQAQAPQVAQAVPAASAARAASVVRQESIASSVTSQSTATSISESDQADQVKQSNKTDSVADAFQVAAERARLKRQQDAARAQADAEKARRERELERQARKRARDDEEAEAEAERQRVERDARLRRERSAEAQAKANMRTVQARPTTRAQSRPQSQSQSQTHDLANSQSQSQSQPQTQLSGATLVDSFPATPSAAAGLRSSRNLDSARSFVEESRILDELEVLTPQSRASNAPLEPRARRIVKPEPLSGGAPSSRLPAHSNRPDRPGPFVPTARPAKSVQPNQQNRATPPTTSSPDAAQQTTRSAAAVSGGISSLRNRPKPAAVNTETESSILTYSETDDDQVIESVPDPEPRPRPSSREGENRRRGSWTEHNHEVSRSYLRRRNPSRRTVDPNDVTSGGRVRLMPWWMGGTIPRSLRFLKLIPVLFLAYAILQALFVPFQFSPGPDATSPPEQVDKVKDQLNGPSPFPEGVRQGLESSLPVMIHVRRDANGKLVIDDEFWLAMRNRIKTDDSILSLDKDSPPSDARWQLLKDRLNLSDDAQADLTSWDDWLANNKRKVANVLSGDVTESIKEVVVTKEEFVKRIEEAFTEHEQALAEQRGAWEADLTQLRGRLGSVSQIVQDMKAKPQGMSTEETSQLVEELVRNAIRRADDASVSADWELKGRMNYFAPGNGALVDVSLSSPDYVTSKSYRWWPFQISSYGRMLNNPKLAALFEWDEPGNCWCAAIIGKQDIMQSADIAVKLAGFVIPQYVVVEHINPKITLNPKAMPKDMEVWAEFDEENKQHILDWSVTQFPSTYRRENPDDNMGDQRTIQEGFHKIGEFTYEYVPEKEGIMVHRLSPELINLNAATDIVLIKAKTNHGADHTCFYRIRLYGEPVELIEPVAPTVKPSKESGSSTAKTADTTTFKKSFYEWFVAIPDAYVNSRRKAEQDKKEQAEKARLEREASKEAAEVSTTEASTTAVPTTSGPKQGWLDALRDAQWMPFRSRSTSTTGTGGEEEGEKGGWIVIEEEVEVTYDEYGNEITSSVL